MPRVEFLTGRTRTRAALFFRRLVLQVQVFYRQLKPNSDGFDEQNFIPFEWRDARAEDLFQLQYLTYGRVEVDVRLPDFDPPESSLPGEIPPPKKAQH